MEYGVSHLSSLQPVPLEFRKGAIESLKAIIYRPLMMLS